uniref:SERPIN domain-containing protein n=1 Tax=Angiostrongylus cantonensis TaxID=6313 RepID=A0A158PAS4_ANGCA
MFLTTEMDFGLAMLRHVPLNASAVVSPISVIFTLAMLQAGARSNTKEQIDELITKGFSDESITGYFSNLSNAILNGTDGVQTRMANDAFSLIINAIYFTAEWLDEFYRGYNSKAIFHSEEIRRETEFMNDFEVHRQYAEDDQVEVLSLPYKDVSYAFNIFLPKKRFGLESVRSMIDGTAIQKLLSKLEETFISVTIPKIKIETDFKLKEALMNMGVTEIFSDNADLTGISSKPALKISHAAHRAIIEVDEKGTTAAAATLFKVIPKMAAFKKPKKFVADHPFLFILTKHSNPLFMGQFV